MYCVKGHREQHGGNCSSIVTLELGKNAFWQFNMTLSHSLMTASNLSVAICCVWVALTSNRIYLKTS